MGSYYKVRFSDGYNTTKFFSVFDVQLQRAFEDHLVVLGALSEETKTIHALAFVKLNSAELKRAKTVKRLSWRTPTYWKCWWCDDASR